MHLVLQEWLYAAPGSVIKPFFPQSRAMANGDELVERESAPVT